MHQYYGTNSVTKIKKATFCRVCMKDIPLGSAKKNIKYYSNDGIDGKDVCVDCYNSAKDPQDLLNTIFAPDDDPDDEEVE